MKKPIFKHYFRFPYHDRVYGVFGENDFDDFTLNLVETEDFRRLERVYQHGPDFIWDPNLDGTRAEHCLGVYLLLKKLGASREERLAGLVHDLSHTAFSHVADFVYGNHADHVYAEEYEIDFLRRPGIRRVLTEFGFTAERLVKNPNHTLLEKPAPALCADRVDYLYRDLLMKKLVKPALIKENLAQLTVFKGEIVFKNISAARFFGELYLLASEKIFYLPESIFAYQQLGEAVRFGLEKGYLSKEDFFSTDDRVWELLEKSNDSKIRKRLATIVNLPKLSVFQEAGLDRQHLLSKPRAVDPRFIQEDRSVSLSGVDREYARKMAASLAWQKKGFFIKVLKKEA